MPLNRLFSLAVLVLGLFGAAPSFGASTDLVEGAKKEGAMDWMGGGSAEIDETINRAFTKKYPFVQARKTRVQSQRLLVRRFVVDCTKRVGVDAGEDVAALLTGKITSLRREYAPARGTALINLFYVPLAELYGPITADRILSNVVRQVEAMPEGRAFSPRDLL